MQFFSAGESHGKTLVAILSGFPAGLKVDKVLFESDLKRRRSGSGRSRRLDIETDDVKIISGVVDWITTGAPISFLLENVEGTALIENRVKGKGFPRPGHVDYCSYAKFNYDDVSLGSERSSARETVLRVAAGSLCRMLLKFFGMDISSEILEICGKDYDKFDAADAFRDIHKGSYGGVLKVSISDVSAGLGSNVQWFKRLDAELASALMSIPSVKGVFFGDNNIHRMRGAESIDHFSGKSGLRKSNLCGGIEGGISNGYPIEATIYFKPVPTQPFEVDSVSPSDGTKGKCGGGMNDLWCVERAGVIAESMMAIIISSAFLDKFGSDCVGDIKLSYDAYCSRLR